MLFPGQYLTFSYCFSLQEAQGRLQVFQFLINAGHCELEVLASLLQYMGNVLVQSLKRVIFIVLLYVPHLSLQFCDQKEKHFSDISLQLLRMCHFLIKKYQIHKIAFIIDTISQNSMSQVVQPEEGSYELAGKVVALFQDVDQRLHCDMAGLGVAHFHVRQLQYYLQKLADEIRKGHSCISLFIAILIIRMFIIVMLIRHFDLEMPYITAHLLKYILILVGDDEVQVIVYIRKLKQPLLMGHVLQVLVVIGYDGWGNRVVGQWQEGEGVYYLLQMDVVLGFIHAGPQNQPFLCLYLSCDFVDVLLLHVHLQVILIQHSIINDNINVRHKAFHSTINHYRATIMQFLQILLIEHRHEPSEGLLYGGDRFLLCV